MFDQTKNKLEDCHLLLSHLTKATDGASFRGLFNSFINASRAVTNALQAEGKNIPGFKEWYEKKRNEMTNDELLRFLHKARTEDFHEGKHRLNFRMKINVVRYDDFKDQPSADAKLVISGEGPFWVMNQGTSRERRVPAKGGGDYLLEASLNNAPTKHLGKMIRQNDPRSICEIADTYFTSLVTEALEKFASL